MTETAQCPFCELRFSARWELKLHLDAEHEGRVRDKDDAHVAIEENDPDNPKPL
ncbi:hypothetical protein NHL50_19350 [Acidimicrobiia bacterium EGI L10123]|jgi:hypothetical protein|uniref:hypothetical protein n=1 Tax=Salinilacustrithrix flava TaxID=2957203 RepID=UPI002CC93018|nr:hypothetical protein [Acidimicrobiia bacterium EGI L10123]HSP02819.1 hypothetical protein [Acidimicrobiales bacterium]